MPSEVLSLALNSGIGFGVVAGIVSGVCYILAQGIQRRGRNSRRNGTWKCDVCATRFRSFDGILDSDKVVNCARCNAKVCKATCSKKQGPGYAWTCSHCQEPETWFRGILTALQPSQTFKVHDINQQNMDKVVNEVDADLEKLRNREKEQVRDFIERLVSAMLGGELDNISVTRIYEDNKYDVLFSRYHKELSAALTDLGSAFHISIANLPITGQSPCSAHSTLKQIIQKIIREAASLPELREATVNPTQSFSSLPTASSAPSGESQSQHVESSRTYEDLLATAILNKVITSYQEELPRAASRASSRASRSSRPGSYNSGKEYFFGDETLDSKWTRQSQANEDTTSVSSLEEWIRNGNASDHQQGRTKDQMTLTIQQRIEEVSSSDEDAAADEDECDGDVGDRFSVYSRLSNARSVRSKKGSGTASAAVPKIISTEETSTNARTVADGDDSSDAWSENWLLQRRRYNGTASPVPVPMLVPNPSVMCKVQIGDKDVDDTSDLSETGSDFGADEPDSGSFTSDIKSILVESKTVIGGKNVLRDIISTSVDESTKELGRDEEYAEKKVNKSPTSQERLLKNEKRTDLANGAKNNNTDAKEADDVSRSSNGPSSDFLTDGSESIEVNEARNISLLSEPYMEHSSLESNTEQDAEYTEKYATLPRTILLRTKHPVAKPRNRETSIQHNDLSQDPAEDSGIDAKEHSDHLLKDPHDLEDGESENEDFVRIFKGSYSEREKKKWENPVPLANNPYSPENLDRRLSRNSSFSSTSSARDTEASVVPKIVCGMPPSKTMNQETQQTSLVNVFNEDRKKQKNIRFGRDYYIREAAKSTGARKHGRLLSSPEGEDLTGGESPKSPTGSIFDVTTSVSATSTTETSQAQRPPSSGSASLPGSGSSAEGVAQHSVVKPQPRLRTLPAKTIDTTSASFIVKQTVEFLERNEKENSNPSVISSDINKTEEQSIENKESEYDPKTFSFITETDPKKIQSFIAETLKSFDIDEFLELIKETNETSVSSSTPVKEERNSENIERPSVLDLFEEDSEIPPPIPQTPVPTPDKISYEFLGQTDELLFKAFPITIEGDTVNFFTDTEESSMDSSLLNNALNGRPKSLNLSDDSDEIVSLERVYNLETGTIIEKVGNMSREIKHGGKNVSSPEGLKYVTVIEGEGAKSESQAAEVVGQSNRDENFNKVEENILKQNKDTTNRLEGSRNRRDHLDSMIVTGDDSVEFSSVVDEKLVDNLGDTSLLEVPYHFKDSASTGSEERNILATEDTITCNNVQYSLEEDDDDIVQKIMQNLNIEPTLELTAFEVRSEDEETVKEVVDKDNKGDASNKTDEEFSLEYSTLGFNSGSAFGSFEDKKETQHEEYEPSVGGLSSTSIEKEAEISELKDKAIVKKTLDLFSNISTSTEVSKTNSVASAEDNCDADDAAGQPSVKELKKLFSAQDTKPKKSATSHLNGNEKKSAHRAVHSLTARSISREMRQELRNGNQLSAQDKSKKSIADTFDNGIHENRNNNNVNDGLSDDETLVNTKNMIELYENYHGNVMKVNKRTV